MIGYAASSYSNTDYENILVTVYDGFDFAYKDMYDKQDYLVGRTSGRVINISSENINDRNISEKKIASIVSELKLKEASEKFPVVISWQFYDKVNIIKTDYAENISPALVFAGKRENRFFINVTSHFSENTLNAFETSLIVKIINTLVYYSKISVIDGAFNCGNKIYFGNELIKNFFKIFKTEDLQIKISKDFSPKNMHQKLIYMWRMLMCDIVKFVRLNRKSVNFSDAAAHYVTEKVRAFANNMDEFCEYFIAHMIFTSHSDLYYLSFNDVLSLFSDARLITESRKHIAMCRRKAAIAKKNEYPDVVLYNGKIIRKELI